MEGELVSKEEVIRTAHQEAARERLELRHAKGKRSLVTGSVLIAVSLAILFVPMLFSATHAFPWVVIWSCFFGWMAMWGAISVVLGIGHVMDSNRMMRERQPIVSVKRGDRTSELLDAYDERKDRADGSQSYDVSTPPSVTETTTRNLDAP
jgi:protein-S-isoprenylcysteine O-methyltransferase Ste14